MFIVLKWLKYEEEKIRKFECSIIETSTLLKTIDKRKMNRKSKTSEYQAKISTDRCNWWNRTDCETDRNRHGYHCSCSALYLLLLHELDWVKNQIEQFLSETKQNETKRITITIRLNTFNCFIFHMERVLCRCVCAPDSSWDMLASRICWTWCVCVCEPSDIAAPNMLLLSMLLSPSLAVVFITLTMT